MTIEEMMSSAQGELTTAERDAIKLRQASEAAALNGRLNERVGTNRAELMEALEERQDYNLREQFKAMSPEQKAVGRLIGKLLNSTGNDDIEKAFAWAEIEFGMSFSLRDRCLALFQAAESLDLTEATYRGIRKIFNLMNRKD